MHRRGPGLSGLRRQRAAESSYARAGALSRAEAERELQRGLAGLRAGLRALAEGGRAPTPSSTSGCSDRSGSIHTDGPRRAADPGAPAAAGAPATATAGVRRARGDPAVTATLNRLAEILEVDLLGTGRCVWRLAVLLRTAAGGGSCLRMSCGHSVKLYQLILLYINMWV
jgi:hypothetical protein